MINNIDVDGFVRERQDEIMQLVNSALNRAGDIVKEKVSSGEVEATIQDVLPLLLYEVLVTNTVSTLRLVAEMIDFKQAGTGNNRVGH
ncbi:hypothetical protein SAMN05660649_02983 [Desulfotomaculum arcticum]|uniref:Uncharacterized protein n=1 Tax=Desulfotruncus arcticus DSM 17038 TaxID=1121424 RepID=A0A1I2VES5_9FIRM|nr:hypothetical protein [Desulfotruncus arcticus]SFG87844.1 hypothetical protein SAMN05660649_02983 [Desulfotomaculum arcticum] [Desulfotruncus arcticus DSM 17038]